MKKILALVILLGSFQASAFKIEPMSATIVPNKNNSTYPFKISNPTDKPTAIQITPLKSSLSIDGKETKTPADKLFLIQPSQSILMPNKAKIIKVTWLGGPVDSEKVFRLYAEQLPIKMEEEEGTRVNVFVNFMPLLFITPTNAKHKLIDPKLSVKSVGGKKYLEILFENIGTKNIVIVNIRPTATDSSGNPIKMVKDSYKSLRVWAQHKRRIRLEVDPSTSLGEAKGTVNYIVYN